MLFTPCFVNLYFLNFQAHSFPSHVTVKQYFFLFAISNLYVAQSTLGYYHMQKKDVIIVFYVFGLSSGAPLHFL